MNSSGHALPSRSSGVCCAVVGCKNNWRKLKNWKESQCELHTNEMHKDCPCMQPFTMHRFPKKEEERRAWIAALQRKDYKPGKLAVVCGIHFVGGFRNDEHSIPTLHLGHSKEVPAKRRKLVRVSSEQPRERQRMPTTANEERINSKEQNTTTENNINFSTFADDINDHILYKNPQHTNSSTQTTVEMKDASTQVIDDALQFHNYYKSLHTTEYCCSAVQTNPEHFMRWNLSELSDDDCKFYTGLSLCMFTGLVNAISKCAKIKHYKISVSDQIFLLLARLRLGLLYGDLARRSQVSTSYVCKIVNFWIPVMARELKLLINWLPRETICATMPPSFKTLYPETTCIMDCMEIIAEKPKMLYKRAVTYSRYKCHNTFKLVAIAPNGLIMFISDCYGGRASDRYITSDCGILQYLLPGDSIMADRGFTIHDLLPPGVSMKIPCFTKGRSQLPEEEVTLSRRISCLRVHVERAIRKLRSYRILKGVLTLKSCEKIDDIIIICGALCNLQSPIIKTNNSVNTLDKE